MGKAIRPKIGLALGSGGAKGLSHIGIIKVLEENNIPIDFIAGSSIGSVIGGFYAATKDIQKIEGIALSNNWRRTLLLFFDPSLHQGFVSGRKIRNFIENIIGKIHFQDLKIPFSAVATDIKTGEAVAIDKGEVAPAIRASVSIPIIFKPVKLNNRLLFDGGLSLPVPVSVVKKMGADLVVAVNLSGSYFSDYNSNHNNESYGFYKVASTSIKLLQYQLAYLNAREADIVVSLKIGEVGWNKFANGKDVILAGEEAMRQSISQLKELIH